MNGVQNQLDAQVGCLFEEGPSHAATQLLAFVQPKSADHGALEIERANLIGSANWAFQTQSWTLVVDYSRAVDEFLERRGYWTDLRDLLQQGDVAAGCLNITELRVRIHLSFGVLASKQGDWSEAIREYDSARQFAVEQDENILLAEMTGNLGAIYHTLVI